MILVTGAPGHLGANLVRRLLADGADVRILLRSTSDPESVAGLNVEKVYGDLRDLDSVRTAVQGCKQIHHCAALISTVSGSRKHKQAVYESNVVGTRNILRSALDAGVEKVVVTGSLSAVGHDPSKPATEDMLFDPFDKQLPYATSKAFVELECLRAFAEGLPVVLATSCAIIGPYDFKPSRMGRTLIDFANGKLSAYLPGGFEFVAARDMVEGHILSMSKGRPGQKYIFCTQFLTVDELMNIFEQITGQPKPKLRLPAGLMSAVASVSDVFMRFVPHHKRRFTPGAVRLLRMQRRADCSKAQRELGYEPSDITEAFREAYEFFVDRGAIKKPKNVDSTMSLPSTGMPAAEAQAKS